LVEMGVFDHQAPKIVPHPIQDSREPGSGLLWKSCPQLRERRMAAAQMRAQSAHKPSHRIRRAIPIEMAERAKDGDSNRTCKAFNAVEPMPACNKTRVWIGNGDTRFQLLDEGNVSRRPVFDLAQSDSIGRAQSDLLSGSGGQDAGPVSRGRTPEARFEDCDRTDLFVGQTGPPLTGLP